MHRLLRKHREEVLLFGLLVLFGTPFLAFWIVVVDPHRPSPLATITVCLAVSTVMVLIAPALERAIQRHINRRARRKAAAQAMADAPKPTTIGGSA